MKTYLLVDGKNLLWRAESAMSSLSANGKATGGIHGFLSILLRVRDEYQPDGVVICWDDWKNGPAARRRIASSYKERPSNPTPERERSYKRVAEQAQDLIALFRRLGVKQAYSPTWEADDVMGTLARRYAPFTGENHKGINHRVVIFTGDRDLLQCVTKSVTVLRPMQDGSFSEETRKSVKETYGVSVNQFVSWKALVGDPSDGYAGCKGIGEKSATAIFQKFHDVREVLHNVTDEKEWAPLQPRWANLIKASEADIIACKKLATINAQAPLVFLKRKPNDRKAMGLLHKWKMRMMFLQFKKLKKLTWKEVSNNEAAV